MLLYFLFTYWFIYHIYLILYSALTGVNQVHKRLQKKSCLGGIKKIIQPAKNKNNTSMKLYMQR